MQVELSPHILGGEEVRELPERLRWLAGEVRELAVESSLLAALPAWLGSFARLRELHLAGCGDASTVKNVSARSRVALISLGQQRLFAAC